MCPKNSSSFNNNCHWWWKFRHIALFWDLHIFLHIENQVVLYGKFDVYLGNSRKCKHNIIFLKKENHIVNSWFCKLLQMTEIFGLFIYPFVVKKLDVLCYKLQCTVFHLSSTQLWKKNHTAACRWHFLWLSQSYISQVLHINIDLIFWQTQWIVTAVTC